MVYAEINGEAASEKEKEKEERFFSLIFSRLSFHASRLTFVALSSRTCEAGEGSLQSGCSADPSHTPGTTRIEKRDAADPFYLLWPIFRFPVYTPYPAVSTIPER